jgi:hypothetical protein
LLLCASVTTQQITAHGLGMASQQMATDFSPMAIQSGFIEEASQGRL